MARFQVGVQLHPQHTSMDELRAAAKASDELGVDSIWTWDHFYPLYGEPEGPHFEGWSTLTAFAADTTNAKLGLLVGCNSYRNPQLVADIARTVDHISGGRLYLGIGSGWFEKDYDEYGYEFGTAVGRLKKLEADLPIMKDRIAKLNPAPLGPLPILIGGGGEKLTLRLVAQYADAWNTFGPPETFKHKSEVLDQWCADLGRDPSEIERTVGISPEEANEEAVAAYLDAGATHFIVMTGPPFDLDPVQRVLDLARD